jgi:hypothetical protein
MDNHTTKHKLMTFVPVVVDINGVLIHRKWNKSFVPMNDKDHVTPVANKNGAMHVFIRPHAIQFLNAIHEMPGTTLVLWSSMTLEYMKPIVDLLMSYCPPGFRYSMLSQMDCTAVQHPKIHSRSMFMKDVNRIYERFPSANGVVFVDDTAEKMVFPGNFDEQLCIIKTWGGVDSDDVVLRDLITNLPSCVEAAHSN